MLSLLDGEQCYLWKFNLASTEVIMGCISGMSFNISSKNYHF